MKRGMVAISDKRLGIRANKRRIQMRKQLRRAPAAPRANDPINFAIRKSCMQVLQTVFQFARIVKRPTVQRMRAENGPVPEPLQMRHAAFDQLRLGRTRRRQNSKSRARTQCTRLEEWRCHSAVTSPRQTISAGPVSRITASLAGHTVRCGPPSAIAVNARSAPRNAIAAADEAQVPVPDEVVGPHPRSKIRNAISEFDRTRTNSTLVP